MRPERPMRSTFSRLAVSRIFARRRHDAKVDHLEIIAAEHDADDVLADVVHVALHRRQQDLAGGGAFALVRFHEGQEIGDRLFHHARGFDDLRQEHLALAEEIADDIHAGHQRAFDHVERPRGALARLFDIRFDIIGDAVDERIFEPLLDAVASRQAASFSCVLAPAPLNFSASSTRRSVESLRRFKHHVFASLAQLRIDLRIDRELAGVDDAHIHARGDGVIEEHRMHRFAHGLIAAE